MSDQEDDAGREGSGPDGETHNLTSLATRIDAPAALRAARAEATPPASARLEVGPRSTGAPSPAALRALHAEEAARASNFGRVMTVLSIVVLASLPIVNQVTWLSLMMAGTLLALAIGGAWVWWAARSPARYSKRMFRTLGILGFLASLMIEYYAGVFSTSAVAVTLGIAFFGLGDDRRWAFGICLCGTFGYLMLGVLITLGVIPDLGLYTARDAPLSLRLFTLGIVPAVYLTTLWQARSSRRATYDAVERLDEALRLAQQREAQLNEADQNLDAALQMGAGVQGRYTGSLAGKYELGEVVGRGAFGEVYAAEHVESGQRAAVKLMHAHVQHRPEVVRRFLREAELLQRLRAPNVVTVFEVGQVASGAPYIAMELLAGKSLAWVLRKRRQLEPADVVALVTEVARGLAAAHEAGIIHRDIKPQNLFLAEPADGRAPLWKILDFGVAKLRGSDETLTGTAVIGTPGYMSPEQAHGRKADRRCDVFSLGAVAYRALTGRPPFAGVDTPQILFNIAFRMPVRPTEIAPRLRSDIDDVLAIALAKQPDNRFSTAADLAAALEAAEQGQLEPALRTQAVSLVAAAPWGQTVTDPVPGSTVEL
ncbi:MAG TPA: serine/threonine-protein kinase [Polyangia bacterium]|nr:serine/threonine-protein kinase [Polyangia bacterium]